MQRERRSRAVAYQALASHVVVGADPHGRVQVEAFERDRRLSVVPWLGLVRLTVMPLEVVEQSLRDGHLPTPDERVRIQVLLSAERMGREPARGRS